LGLVLAIGIVVDDAIVVVEAVQVNMSKGMSSKEATIKAMQEVSAPVIATTLVLIAVFIPVAGMGGITGRLYQQFAITIAVSVVFSSINALTLSPALCSLLLKQSKPYKGFLGKFFAGFNKVFDRSTETYMTYTNIFTRKISRGIFFIMILVILIALLGIWIPGGFIPEEDLSAFFINIQLPDAASLQRTNVVAKKVENILTKFEEIDFVTTAAGYSLLSGTKSTNAGFIFVTLKDWAERENTALELAQKLNGIFYMQINEAQVFAFGPPAIPGLGSGSGFTLMLQDRSGGSPVYLAEQSQRFIQAAIQRPEIGSIFTTYRANVPQRYVDINRDKLLKAGVPLNSIYATIGAFLGGSYVNDFNRFGRLYKAYIQAEPAYRQNKDQINLFYIKNKNGESIPLSAFVTVKEIVGPDFTNRFNLYRSTELTGAPAKGYSSVQALNALEQVAAEIP
jgi:HAE1 family hydrophobic/amphiphilic exporter-1